MAEIIEDLWRLSESKSNYLDISLESFDLSGVVRKIVDRLKIKMKEKEKIVIIESDVYATGDEGLIKIAVENLLDNANKFTN